MAPVFFLKISILVPDFVVEIFAVPFLPGHRLPVDDDVLRTAALGRHLDGIPIRSLGGSDADVSDLRRGTVSDRITGNHSERVLKK